MKKTNRLLAMLLVVCTIVMMCMPMSALAGDSAPSYWRSVTGSRDDGVFLFPIRSSDGGIGAITDWAGCPGSGTCHLCGDTHLSWAGCAQWHTSNYLGHQGMDIGVGYKDVLAPANGNVYWSSTNWSGRGYTVVMEHPIGNGYSYYSVFQHLSKVDVVSNGTHVTVGTKIAVSGNSTGGSDSSSGAHLHFGMVIDTSGCGNTLAQNANYDSGLLGVEKKGWVLSGTRGTGSGRIVVNPMHADGYLEAPLIDGYSWSMRSHCGSIRLTYDTSKVTPRPYTVDELSISGQKYPTGTLSVGSYFDLYGVISAPDTIRNVTVGVFNRKGEMTSEIKQVNPNSTSFDVHSIDTEIKFNNLSAGYYTYKVIAATTKETKTLVSSNFTVGSPSGSAYEAYDYVPSTTIVDNGHVYSLYEYNMTWYDAKVFCEQRSGHLMTVTSSTEQNALQKLMNMGGTNKVWIGATDIEKEGAWEWITGENFSFTNWNDGEPNNSSSCEHYAHAIKSSGLWNDTNLAMDSAFILEVDVNLTPINSMSENSNVRYELYKSKMPWTEAKAYCEAIGGHLVTITSDAEANNINYLLNGHTAEKSRIWLGATDRATEGNWKWVTDEQWSYANWGNGQPDNDTGEENYLEIRTEYSNTWNDGHNYNTTALDWYFICEYETATCTVTFKDWDGTILKTQTVEHGASATAPANPTRTGYTFTGWDKDFANVTSNLTVTAQYKINTYTVTFKDWDGTVLKTQSVEHGASATAPTAPSRPNYQFTGWDKNFTNVTSDLVVTAQYVLIQTNANIVVTSVEGKPGETVRVPIMIEKNPGIMAIGIDVAYDASVLELVGTEKGDIFTGNVFEVPSQNLTDNPYRYTVTDATNEYSADGTLVTYIFKIKETAQPGKTTALELSIPFAYNLAEQQVYFNANSGVVRMIPPINAYTVTFKDWDGTVLKTQEVNEGESSTAPANPTRPGYVFTGWDKDFTNVHSDLVVTAKYRLANGAELTVQSKTSQAGQIVEIAVEITKNPGIMYLRITPDYDKSYLTLTGVKNGNVFPDNAFSYDTNVTFDVMSNNTANGTLLIVTFKVADNAPEGSYKVGITVRECYNYNEDDVDVTSVNGAITVSSILYGDVNGDGVIDGKDVIRLRKYLAAFDDETGTSSVEIRTSADYNGDGKVDGKDLVRLRKYLAAYDDDTGTSPVHLGPEN